jgi:hypothetical protein
MSTDPEQVTGSSEPEPGTEPVAQGPPVPPTAAPLPLWPTQPTPGYAPKAPAATTYQAAAPPPPAPPERGSGPPVPIWPAAAPPAGAAGRPWRIPVVLVAATLIVVSVGAAAVLMGMMKHPAGSSTAAPAATGSLQTTAAAAASAPATAGASGSAGAAPGVPGSYRAVGDLCAVVKDGALTQLYPTRSDVTHENRAGSTATDMSCAEVLRSGSASRDLRIQASVSTDGSARTGYEALRQAVMARGTVPMVVAGLGSAAFAYQDSGSTQVVALDGNLVITVLWGGRDEPDLTSRLIDVCRSTMAGLKA